MAGFSGSKPIVTREEKEYRNLVTNLQTDSSGSLINNANYISNKSSTCSGIFNASTNFFNSSSMTISYLNPIFEGTKEIVAKLNDVILNVEKHSSIIFKENNDPNWGSLGSGEIYNRGCDTSIATKKHGSVTKGGQIRSGRRLN